MKCSFKRCRRVLRSDNKTGYCQRHKYVYVKPENKETARLRAERWRKDNPERVEAYNKEYREKNREALKQRHKNYRKNHPEVYMNYKVRKGLEVVEAAKQQPARVVPRAHALLKLAEAKASQASYGIERIGYAR